MHWECLDSEDELAPESEDDGSESDVANLETEGDESDADMNEPENIIPTAAPQNAFDLLDGKNSNKRKRYERGPQYSSRHMRRKRQQAREGQHHARRTGQIIEEMLAKRPPAPVVIPKEPEEIKRESAIKGMERKLREDRSLNPTNLMRHQAVLSLLRLLLKRERNGTREKLARIVARSFNQGRGFARRISQWEKSWVEERIVPESRRGLHIKTKSWLNDEGIQLEVRRQVSMMKEGQSRRYQWPREDNQLIIQKASPATN